MRIGLVIQQEQIGNDDVVLVMWTDAGGVKIRKHICDAVVPITEITKKKIEERICDIK